MALALYGRVRVGRSAPASGDRRMHTQLLEGLSFVAHDFVFAALICLALFNALFGLSYVTLLPVFADSYFHAGSASFGLLNAAHGAGALVGTLTVASIAHRILRPGTTLLVTAVGLGLALMLFSWAPRLEPALLMLLLVGFCNTFYLTQVSTFLQRRVTDRLRGRMMSIYLAVLEPPAPGPAPRRPARGGGEHAAAPVLVGGGMVAVNALALPQLAGVSAPSDSRRPPRL